MSLSFASKRAGAYVYAKPLPLESIYLPKNVGDANGGIAQPSNTAAWPAGRVSPAMNASIEVSTKAQHDSPSSHAT
jgi:hypothetical protein